MSIRSPAGAEQDRSQTRARCQGPARPQLVVSDRAVIPTDAASLGTLTETINREVRQYESDEEIENEWTNVLWKMGRMRSVDGRRMWGNSGHHR